MRKVWVNLGERSYYIYIGKGLLPSLPKFLQKWRRLFLVTDRNVATLYGEKLCRIFSEESLSLETFIIEADEEHKNIQTAIAIYEAMINAELGRDTLLLAMGGGMVGDIAGFCAATYMRGVDYVQIPTTLLAQIDSSIGGKTAVNHPCAKNIIGCFYQPKMVISDIDTLKTLPQRQIKNAMAEAVKYGVIKDEELFFFLEDNAEDLMKLDEEKILKLIEWCARIKAEIVAEDEMETKSIRSILNFGHTIGHAIEAALSYRGILHGEAVSVGMCTESFIAEQLNICKKEDIERIINLLSRFSLPTHIEGIEPSGLYKSMMLDKKKKGKKLLFALPTRVGNVIIKDDVPEEILEEAIEKFL